MGWMWLGFAVGGLLGLWLGQQWGARDAARQALYMYREHGMRSALDVLESIAGEEI
jgi:hypothetical protein